MRQIIHNIARIFCQCGCARCSKGDHCFNRRCLQ